MAREVVIRMLDDIDRTQEATKVDTIGFRGFIYELDLTEEHYDELGADLDRWLKAAHHKVKWPKQVVKEAKKAVPAKKAAGRGSNLTGEQRREAREWGRANGFTVANRGYLNPDLVKAYKKAQRNVTA